MNKNENIKFTKEFSIDDWEVLTPTGYKDISMIYQTIEYDIYHVVLDNGLTLECADRHKLIKDDGYTEIFADELQIGDRLATIHSSAAVIQVSKLVDKEVCYDLSLNDDNHVYYTNGILSHNTTIIAAYCLQQLITRPDITIALLANKESSSIEILSRIKFAYSMLPYYMKQGVLKWNEKSIKIANGNSGSTIFAAACSPDSIRGKSCAIIYLDEYAFVDNAVEFYESTYPTISASSTSQVIITSTPKGLNHFYKLWKEANEGQNKYVPFFSPWWENPTRGEDWEESTRKNMSPQSFAQEYACEFLGSSLTLISGNKLKVLSGSEPLIKESEHYSIYKQPNPKHKYVLSIDVSEGLGQDYSVIQVIDITNNGYEKEIILNKEEIEAHKKESNIILPDLTDINELDYETQKIEEETVLIRNSEKLKSQFEQVAVYRNNLIQPDALASIAATIAKQYNNAYIIVEYNSIGKITADALFYDLGYENMFSTTSTNGDIEANEGVINTTTGIRQTTRTKRIGCATLKALVESDVLKLNNNNTIDELTTFTKVKESYKAVGEGKTDDAVMALVLFAWLVSTNKFKEALAVDSDDMRGTILSISEKEFDLIKGVNVKMTRKDETSIFTIGYGEDKNQRIEAIGGLEGAIALFS